MACKVILYSTPHLPKTTGFERHDPFLLVALTWNDPYIYIYIAIENMMLYLRYLFCKIASSFVREGRRWGLCINVVS